MQLPTTLLTLCTLLLTPPSLALNIPRAGAPPYTPLPPTCTLTSPLPPPATNYSTPLLVPSASVRASSLLYQTYFALPDTTSMAERWEGCVQQCNGLAGCKAAFMADGVKTPKKWYGTTGGKKGRGCLLFDRELGAGDFVEKKGVEGGTAGNLECGSSEEEGDGEREEDGEGR
ncbi:hypothetical protein BDZ85DRAFT_281770 [Elsinoe ampelina]|uniref:Apple domain-containing protein n=1 Tax=Elsinoe ampelina TaxID=302913 RepID=A0A6A6GDT6_9PEZI|nr:hypothetical protein BDZ85DRAFT_281770 [Elsinoe ampelina]